MITTPRQRTLPKISLRRAHRFRSIESSFDKIDMFYHRDSCHIELSSYEDLLRERLQKIWMISLESPENRVLTLYITWCKSRNLFMPIEQAIADLKKAQLIFSGAMHLNRMRKVINKLKAAIAVFNQGDDLFLNRVFTRHCILRDLAEFEDLNKTGIPALYLSKSWT